jgi:tetratricopeptide (TPR) repeat protein
MTEQTHWSDRDVDGPANGTGAGVGPDAGTATAAAGNGESAGESAEESAGRAEQVRLDAAIERADELLVDSLRRDEVRRRRRRRGIVLAISGGLTMTAIICVLLAALAGQGKNSGDEERAATLTADGWKLWEQRKMSDAEAKFAEAVKLDASKPGAWNGLGWSRVNQGKIKEAIEPFEKVLALEPDHPAALNGLGQSYLGLGKLDESEKFLLKAAAKDASAAWWGLARLYLAKGDFDRALPWALLVVKEQPADQGGQEMLAAAKKRKIDDELRKQLEPMTGGAKKKQ